MDHLGVIESAADLLLVNYDNQAAKVYTKDPKYHGKTKHIDTNYTFVKDMIARKDVNLEYILRIEW